MSRPPPVSAAGAPTVRSSPWWRALRPHQWSKNLLVFVPLVAAHRYGDPAALVAALAAFVAFSLAASAMYVVNDLADRPADRRHPRKRRRPFAAGELAPRAGVVAAIALLVAAAALAAAALPAPAALTLAGYVALALAYSATLKRLVVVDVVVLAVLYTLRVLAGAAAIGVTLSAWLAGASLALFASLALAKRYVEVLDAGAPATPVPGRAYTLAHGRGLRAAGIACAIALGAVVVAYALGDEAARHYARPGMLVALGALMLAWLCRVWMRASAGRMHDDPIVDAATDPAGLALVAAGVATFLAAL